MLSGYLHPLYAESLSEFGTPRELKHCSGWILVRQIPGVPYFDAMGCYPLFACLDWTKLYADLQEVGDDLISLSLVTDPFGGYNQSDLYKCFDQVIPFKEHYIVDLFRPINETVSKHHRKYSRKALSKITVEACEEPIRYIDEWIHLYASLIKRHNVNGIRAFSEVAFQKQLRIPGFVMFRAIYQDTVIGATLMFTQGDVAYAHLMGIDEIGYKLGAPYALRWSSIQYFKNKVHWLDLGGISGIHSNSSDGLSFFKQGWSTGTRTAYFCGKVFNQEKYAMLVDASKLAKTNYFPAYRYGEMGN